MRLKVKLPIFKSPLILHVGEDAKDAYQKEVLSYFPKVDPDDFAMGDGKCCGSFVWIRRPEVGMLAHELVHFADEVTKHLGVKDANREVEAYIVGYCMDKVWPKIQEAK